MLNVSPEFGPSQIRKDMKLETTVQMSCAWKVEGRAGQSRKRERSDQVRFEVYGYHPYIGSIASSQEMQRVVREGGNYE